MRLEIVNSWCVSGIPNESGFHLTQTNPIFPRPRPGRVLGHVNGYIPQLHLSRSGRLLPALWGARARSYGSGRCCNVPAPEPEPRLGRTAPQAAPSARPATETGNGPASPWGSIDPVPGKDTAEITVQTSRWGDGKQYDIRVRQLTCKFTGPREGHTHCK